MACCDKIDDNCQEYLREKVGFYEFLNDSERAIILSGVTNSTFAKGEQVHNSNGVCSGVLIVKSGRLRAYMLSDEGREITLYYIESGDTCIMTASCVMSCISFEVHIEAEEDTSALIITPNAFQAVSQSNMRVENFALHIAVDRFADVMWAMQQILFFSMDKRLAMYLYDESSKTKSLEITTTHEQIAKALASAREVVTRLLQEFQKRGIVELSRGKIRILDKKVLADMSK